jgi:hypothetical protein
MPAAAAAFSGSGNSGSGSSGARGSGALRERERDLSALQGPLKTRGTPEREAGARRF